MNLYPCFFDNTREKSDIAHSRLAKEPELEETHNLASLLSDAPQSASGLSARSIFLAGELPLIVNVYDDGTQWDGPVYFPDMLRQRTQLACWNRLDQWQRKAIKTSDEYPLALTHGSPGTGKTSIVVAYIVSRLTRIMNEKFMICSPRNVAVSVLVQSTVAAIEQDNLKYPNCNISRFSIVHVESEGMIDTTYLCGWKFTGDYHLQNLRIQRAKDLERGAFTSGVKVLERDGYVSDAKEWKKYKEERE